MVSPLTDNLPGRPAERRNEIVDFIHGMILSGKLKPGGRLPIRRKLQVKFNSSMSTVQQAIDRLVSEGFVESKGVGGTFVSANPPPPQPVCGDSSRETSGQHNPPVLEDSCGLVRRLCFKFRHFHQIPLLADGAGFDPGKQEPREECFTPQRCRACLHYNAAFL